MRTEPMRAIRVLIDTNLLVLLVVGRTDQHLISKHRGSRHSQSTSLVV